jgi:hypothetical protein
MNGIYAIYFTGLKGFGHGVIVIKDGLISGADAAGALYDGSCTVSSDGAKIEGMVVLKIPPEGMLVTGAVAGSSPQSYNIPLSLPTNFGDGDPLLIQTGTGPVNVSFKKLRDL